MEILALSCESSFRDGFTNIPLRRIFLTAFQAVSDNELLVDCVTVSAAKPLVRFGVVGLHSHRFRHCRGDLLCHPLGDLRLLLESREFPVFQGQVRQNFAWFRKPRARAVACFTGKFSIFCRIMLFENLAHGWHDSLLHDRDLLVFAHPMLPSCWCGCSAASSRCGCVGRSRGCGFRGGTAASGQCNCCGGKNEERSHPLRVPVCIKKSKLPMSNEQLFVLQRTIAQNSLFD